MTVLDARSEAISEVFDAKAPHYDEDHMHRGLARAVAEFVHTADVTDVLDVATGTGLVLRALQDAGLQSGMIGVDVSAQMLAVAHAHLPTATLAQGDAAALPLGAASVDLVTCVTGLHLFPDPLAAAREWRRVLRPGGRIVTATFAEGGFHPRNGAVFAVDHDSFRTPELLRQFGQTFGFTVTRHRFWSDKSPQMLITELAGQEDGHDHS
ncbi:methyltransferase domain-containing protein [Microbacterium protaetiae]|uniref:Methyltransferase domain-containing protein n=1 Tax=Microbacterium protaetiae TaxID=2509458 RepID=A0A4P6EMH9_9MICO|nr:methyltransferase domain-containing protein [Microbacterium protaetiae]QAY61447.1 methyltransferase domain-containing protein [Microbacterium protaetiae]